MNRQHFLTTKPKSLLPDIRYRSKYQNSIISILNEGITKVRVQFQHRPGMIGADDDVKWITKEELSSNWTPYDPTKDMKKGSKWVDYSNGDKNLAYKFEFEDKGISGESLYFFEGIGLVHKSYVEKNMVKVGE